MLLSAILSSCHTFKQYQKPAAPDADLFRQEYQATDSFSIATLPWKDFFKDTYLQSLLQEGIENNYDLLTALTRVQQAEAYYAQSKQALLPTLSGRASVDHSKSTVYQLGVSSSWELDIWGKLSSSKRASLASLLRTQAGSKAVQTNLVSAIASSYYQLLSLDKQLQITEQTVENWKSTVTTMKALKEASRVTEAAVVQSQALQYAAEVTIPDLKQNIKRTENALSILIGRKPGEIARGSLDAQVGLTNVEVGLPAQLLANRPDVQMAELNLREQFEMTNVARAYFYPSLSITGSAGQVSNHFGDLFNASATLGQVTAGLLQPIFNGRLNRTRLEVAKAEQQAAFYAFQASLLTAAEEVSNALSEYETALQKATIRIQQLDALEKSVEYSQELLENGFANYTEVITARQNLLQAELSGVNDQLQKYSSVIELYRALGGGWW